MKNNVYPCKPQFYYIKVGFKGVKIIYACFRDARRLLHKGNFLMLPPITALLVLNRDFGFARHLLCLCCKQVTVTIQP